ncbi:MAG: universal stress protein [Rhodobacteraceae bacterium]|nr:universal stress protein [Paracoccaceae bacterium]
MTKPIVVAFDGSDAGRRAVSLAADLAGSSGATLVVAHVLEWSPYSFLTQEELHERHKRRAQEVSRAEQALVQPVVDDLTARGLNATGEIRYGHVAETLVEIAQAHDAGQIVIGRLGAGGLSARLFGSVAGTLAQIAPVPVTIVP